MRIGSDHTDWFSVETREQQGYVLSLLLFNLVFVFFLRKLDLTDGGITWIGKEKLKDLDYAGYIYLLTESFEEMQRLTDKHKNDTYKIGLTISCSKTEIIKMYQSHTTPISVDSAALNEVKNFTCLGCSIMNE